MPRLGLATARNPPRGEPGARRARPLGRALAAVLRADAEQGDGVAERYAAVACEIMRS
ncbi:MAG: hypothetical protein JXA67_03935 [Micromonosporaceae bacterium]|nr:hypothetical protein [Micromonosporaceae bacterium]